MSKSEKSEEKCLEKTINRLDITFNDGSEITFRTPDDKWITTYEHYLLVLHGQGRSHIPWTAIIYIPWTAIKQASEYKVVIQNAEN